MTHFVKSLKNFYKENPYEFLSNFLFLLGIFGILWVAIYAYNQLT